MLFHAFILFFIDFAFSRYVTPSMFCLSARLPCDAVILPTTTTRSQYDAFRAAPWSPLIAALPRYAVADIPLLTLCCDAPLSLPRRRRYIFATLAATPRADADIAAVCH